MLDSLKFPTNYQNKSEKVLKKNHVLGMSQMRWDFPENINDQTIINCL